MKKLRLLALGAATVAATATIAATTSCSAGGDKFGFIFLHDEKSTYDKNFIEAAKTACENLGVKPILKTNVPEGEECKTTAKELAEDGCKGIFADSFGHEPFLIEVANEFKDVQFAHATGTNAHTEKLSNFHNAFASIYEGRYIAGIAAGMKLNQMIDNGTISAEQAVMGYVGAFNYAEVVSGYTSFYLGAKSVCPSVTMKVRYTNSWYDENAEKATATTLIEQDGCKLISQHADSQGAPSVCNSKSVPNVFYNGQNLNLTNSYLTSCRINWVPFFEYFIKNTLENTQMDYDYCGTLATGSVEYYDPSAIAAPGTKDAMDAAAEQLKNGTLNVFDTTKFTVSTFGDGVETFTNLKATVDAQHRVINYNADVNSDADFAGDTEVINGTVFQESKFRSAPYFDIRIDGITEL